MRTKTRSKWGMALLAIALTFTTSFSKAQCDSTCTENNLITNGDFQAGNTGFSTDFDYSCTCIDFSVCVADEGRGKCNNPSTWFDDTWDHTFGDSTGLYLVVDGRASTDPDRIYFTNVSVTAGQTYTFSFWHLPRITSTSSYPTLQMVINGANVGSAVSATGDNWLQFCTDWTATSSGTIEISINQTNSGYSGNDFGIDDIYFGTCSEPCEVEAKWDVTAGRNCDYYFTDESSYGSSSTPVSWLWTFGDGTSSTEENPTHYYSSPGTYEVCLTVTAVNFETGECCIDTYCSKVEINCEPGSCTIEHYFKWTESCNACEIQFDGIIGYTNRNITAWFWDFGDGTTGTGEDPVHTFPGSGSYEVCVTVVGYNEDECCVETYCEEIQIECEKSSAKTSSAKIIVDHEANLAVYPNPLQDNTTISYEISGDSKVSIFIHDLQGREIARLVDNQMQDAGKYMIDVDASDLGSGIYLCTLRAGSTTKVEKLIIQK
ncbi:MAG: hypothetical protein CL843_04625 [Crocinitomicaceae bacterium]|nr:hypothetical protein [Crocinitomicaceae bacterium]|tara:strand:- start:137 stop:1603 length:1467 start_codon:yes stop_codon:yes gene_type:complete